MGGLANMPSSIHHAGATRQTGETWPEIWCHLYGNTSESRHLDTSMINASDKTAPAASPFQTFSTSSVFRVATVFPKTKSESDNTNCFSFSASFFSPSSLQSFSKNQIRIRQHQLLPVPSTSSLFRLSRVFPKTESNSISYFPFLASSIFESREFFQKPNSNQTAPAASCSLHLFSLSSLESFSKNQIWIRQHQLLPVSFTSSLFRISRVFPKTKSESDNTSCFLFPPFHLSFESWEFFQKPNLNQIVPAVSCSLYFFSLSSLESFSKNQIRIKWSGKSSFLEYQLTSARSLIYTYIYSKHELEVREKIWKKCPSEGDSERRGRGGGRLSSALFARGTKSKLVLELIVGAIMYQGIRRIYTANWAPAKRSGGHISIIRGNYSERGARPSSSILIFSARKPPPPPPPSPPHRARARMHTSTPVTNAKLVPSDVPPPHPFRSFLLLLLLLLLYSTEMILWGYTRER